MDILPRRAPTIETELTNTEQQTGLVPKLIANNPDNNFINPFAFKKLSSLNSAYKTYAESSDEVMNAQFAAEQAELNLLNERIKSLSRTLATQQGDIAINSQFELGQ